MWAWEREQITRLFRSVELARLRTERIAFEVPFTPTKFAVVTEWAEQCILLGIFLQFTALTINFPSSLPRHLVTWACAQEKENKRYEKPDCWKPTIPEACYSFLKSKKLLKCVCIEERVFAPTPREMSGIPVGAHAC